MITVREALVNTDILELSNRYAEAAWAEGWKPGKAKAKMDPNDPYLGGPMDVAANTSCRFLQDKDGNTVALVPGLTASDLSEASLQFLASYGITFDQHAAQSNIPVAIIQHIPTSRFLGGANGKAIELTPLTRIRVRQLSDDSLAHLGILHLKSDKTAGKDVCHQEDVATYAENIANDYKHHLNNALAIAACLEAFVSWLTDADLSVDDAIATIEALLARENPALAQGLTMSARMAWIGRAMQDGSYKVSADFTFYHRLGQNAAGLDEYVVAPMFRRFADDLRKGTFVNS